MILLTFRIVLKGISIANRDGFKLNALFVLEIKDGILDGKEILGALIAGVADLKNNMKLSQSYLEEIGFQQFAIYRNTQADQSQEEQNRKFDGIKK